MEGERKGYKVTLPKPIDPHTTKSGVLSKRSCTGTVVKTADPYGMTNNKAE
jgi:hypothetical protein